VRGYIYINKKYTGRRMFEAGGYWLFSMGTPGQFPIDPGRFATRRCQHVNVRLDLRRHGLLASVGVSKRDVGAAGKFFHSLVQRTPDHLG